MTKRLLGILAMLAVAALVVLVVVRRANFRSMIQEQVIECVEAPAMQGSASGSTSAPIPTNGPARTNESGPALDPADNEAHPTNEHAGPANEIGPALTNGPASVQ